MSYFYSHVDYSLGMGIKRPSTLLTCTLPVDEWVVDKGDEIPTITVPLSESEGRVPVLTCLNCQRKGGVARADGQKIPFTEAIERLRAQGWYVSDIDPEFPGACCPDCYLGDEE